MEWTKALIEYWIEHYYELRAYELNPFSEVHIFKSERMPTANDIYISGEGKNAPYIETCNLNWEFDRALRKLGDKEAEFRKLYLNGEGENEELFNKLLELLKENE